MNIDKIKTHFKENRSKLTIEKSWIYKIPYMGDYKECLARKVENTNLKNRSRPKHESQCTSLSNQGSVHKASWDLHMQFMTIDVDL